MPTRDRFLVAAIALSVALHIAALFGTPRFDLAWMYEEVQPTPIEVRIVAPEPPAKVVEAKPPRPAARKPAPRPKPAPAAAPVPAPNRTIGLLEAPSPDGEPIPPIARGADEPTTTSNPEVATEPPASDREITDDAQLAEYPLKQARLVYDLYYGRSPTKVGQVTHTWSQAGHRYSVESVAEAVGFISFFFGGRFVQRSMGQLGRAGLLPDDYTLERGRGDQPEVAHFDWEQGKLALTWKNESRLVKLPPGAQDPLSMLHQLYFIKSIPATARLDIVTSRKLVEHVYELVNDEELLETPLGMLTTLHFRRREVDGTLMEVWLDLHRNVLPARIYFLDRKGRVLDQIIREAHIELAETPG